MAPDARRCLTEDSLRRTERIAEKTAIHYSHGPKTLTSRRRLQVGARHLEPHAREVRHRSRHGRVRRAGHRIFEEQSPRRDFHGSSHARHGRLAGGAGDQGQSADGDDPDHDVHLARGGTVCRSGARARRHGRVAEAGAARRRVESIVRITFVAGPARHGRSCAGAGGNGGRAAGRAPPPLPVPPPASIGAAGSNRR